MTKRMKRRRRRRRMMSGRIGIGHHFLSIVA
jgi:hypothetical protein